MIYINSDLISKIKERVNIVDIISEDVKIEKRGNNYIGLCPFHKEKTPSFSINEEKGFYKCFGCGVSGDVITFLEDYRNMSFEEAVEYLATKANISLQYSKREREEDKIIDMLYKINEDANIFFTDSIKNSKTAIEYLKKRSISPKTAKKYNLGYAPLSWNNLKNYLLKKSYSEELLLKAGLIKKKDEKSESYDVFRNRLMFPIYNTSNKIVGFSGRSLDNNDPKYLNTKENEIFKKRKLLFGLNILKKETDRKKIILVEGNIDVLSLYQNGVNYAVANLGTSFTVEQADILKNLSETIYICYDGDKAGKNATLKAIDIFKNIGIKPFIISIPDNMDPDDYIKKMGTSNFGVLLKNAKGSIEYLIEHYYSLYNTRIPEEKIKFIYDTVREISKLKQKMERDIYIDYFANSYSIDKDLLKEEVEKNFKRQIKFINTKKQKYIPKINKISINDIDSNLSILVLFDKEFFHLIKNKIEPDFYSEVLMNNINIIKHSYELETSSLDDKEFLKTLYLNMELKEILKYIEDKKRLKYDEIFALINDLLKKRNKIIYTELIEKELKKLENSDKTDENILENIKTLNEKLKSF